MAIDPYTARRDPATGRFLPIENNPILDNWAATEPDPMKYVNGYIKSVKGTYANYEALVGLTLKQQMTVTFGQYGATPDTGRRLYQTIQQADAAAYMALRSWAGLRDVHDLVLLLIRLNRVHGYLVNLLRKDVKYMTFWANEPDPVLANEIKIMEKWMRQGALPDLYAAQRAARLKDLLDALAAEGVYGYFEYPNTSRAKWHKTGAGNAQENARLEAEERKKEAAYMQEYENKFWQAAARARAEYEEIYVPGFNDVIAIPAIQRMTPEQKKARKKQQLEHMLHSPNPRIAQKLQRIATLTDAIEDYLGTGTAATWGITSLLSRWSPFIAEKVAPKLLPGIGWLLMAETMLNLVTGLFSSASNPMGAKRILESARRLSPKKAWAAVKDVEELKKWRPGVGALLEAGEAAQQLTGYGLHLAAIMGCISEIFWGVHDMITGDADTLRIVFPWGRIGPPSRQPGAVAAGRAALAAAPPSEQDKKAYNAIKPFLELLPAAVTFETSEQVPLMITFQSAAELGTKQSFHHQWADIYDQIKDWPLIENPPDNPITREVLSEMGFDPDKKVGHLYIDGPEMPTVKELMDLYPGDPAEHWNQLITSTGDTWQTYARNCIHWDFDRAMIDVLAYPNGGVEYHNTSDLDMLIIAAKMSIIPPKDTPQYDMTAFCDLMRNEILRLKTWPSKTFIQRVAIRCWGQFDIQCPPVKVWHPH
jgi:hypothetical protein